MGKTVVGRSRRARPSRSRTTAQTWIGIAGIVCLILGCPTAADARPAADQADAHVTITLTSMSPAVPTPGQPVRFRGTIVNTGTVALTDKVRAYACIDGTPMTTSSQIAAIPSQDDGSCRTLYSPSQPAGQELHDRLEPGQRVALDMSVPWRTWRISANGAYLVGVKVIGGVDGTRVTAGAVRTLLPVMLPGSTTQTSKQSPAVKPVDLALAVPLVAQPGERPDKLFQNDLLAASIGSTGRLGRLVAAAGTWPITWMLDPNIAAETATMTSGYQVVRGHSTPTSGSGKSVAGSWRAALKASVGPQNPAVLLPYADPDVTSLAAQDLPGIVTAAVQKTRETAASVPASNRLTGSLVTSPTAAALNSLAASAPPSYNLIAANSWSAGSLPDVRSNPRVSIRLGAKSLNAIVTTPALTAGGPDTGSVAATSGIAIRQRLLAETQVAAISAKGQQTTLVAALPRTIQPELVQTMLGGARAPWIHPVGMSAIGRLATQTAPPPDSPTSRPVQTSPPPSADDVALLRSLQGGTGILRSIVRDPAAPDVAAYGTAVLRSASGDFTAPAQRTQFLSAAVQLNQAQLAKVLIQPPRLVTLSGANGRFPLTIDNRLNQTVKVRLGLSAVTRTDLQFEDPGPIEIGPNRQQTVVVKAKAGANGLVPTQAVLLTPVPGSQVMVGQPKVFNIRATSFGNVGWVLIIGGAVVLFGTSAFRIYRRIRRDRAADTASPAS